MTATQESTTTAATTARRLRVTTEVMLDVRFVSDVALAADGSRAAFTRWEFVPDAPRRRSRVWTVETAGGEAQPLATGEGDASNPRFSPDGTRIAFISRREENGKPGKPQLYLMPAAGGEARRLTNMPNGVDEAEWAPDGSRIGFLSLEGEAPSQEPKVIAPDRHRRLWAIRPESATAEPITPPNLTVWEYAWSPDGKRLALYYSDGPDETDWYHGHIGIVPVNGGAVRKLVHMTRQAAALAWSPDGAQLAYISGEWSDRGLVGGDIFLVDVGTAGVAGEEVALAEPRNLTPGIEDSPGWVGWYPDGQRLLYAASSGTAHTIGTVDIASGAITPLAEGFTLADGAWPRLVPSADLRRFVTLRSDRQHPADVWLGDLVDTGDGAVAWKQLTRLHTLLEETVELAPAEKIEYEGADGWRIEALLTLPPEAQRGTPPPLIVNVHGGPSSAWRTDWRGGAFLTQRLAAAGFAVLQPNPRGSIGRGVAFADAVLGDMGGKDLQDILAGVDEVVRRGLVDGERVGIVGWSYGGFMVAWAVTQTPRFKAAMMGAGISDYHSFHAQSNIPDWDERFIGARPNEHPEAYRARSAMTFASRITTPTLILHGENDVCVPVNQAYAFYRALRDQNVPVELAVYPREGHGFAERAHLLDMDTRVVRWFEMYL